MRKSAVERQLTIIGLRNMIVHEYDEVKHEKIWIISKKYVPALVKELKKIAELKPYIQKENNWQE